MFDIVQQLSAGSMLDSLARVSHARMFPGPKDFCVYLSKNGAI